MERVLARPQLQQGIDMHISRWPAPARPGHTLGMHCHLTISKGDVKMGRAVFLTCCACALSLSLSLSVCLCVCLFM